MDFSVSSPQPDETTTPSLSWTSSAIPLTLDEYNTQGHADLRAPRVYPACKIQDEGEVEETEPENRDEGQNETLTNDREVAEAEERRNAKGRELERFEELNMIVESGQEERK